MSYLIPTQRSSIGRCLTPVQYSFVAHALSNRCAPFILESSSGVVSLQSPFAHTPNTTKHGWLSFFHNFINRSFNQVTTKIHHITDLLSYIMHVSLKTQTCCDLDTSKPRISLDMERLWFVQQDGEDATVHSQFHAQKLAKRQAQRSCKHQVVALNLPIKPILTA
jgi:hypothetical protein